MEPRKTLGLRGRTGEETSESRVRALLSVAIGRRLMVTAVYNKRRVRLAPHALFTKHDDLHLDAVTVDQDGSPPNNIRVGTFKLSGLTEIAPTGLPFQPHADFDPTDPKYGETLVAAVEPATPDAAVVQTPRAAITRRAFAVSGFDRPAA